MNDVERVALIRKIQLYGIFCILLGAVVGLVGGYLIWGTP